MRVFLQAHCHYVVTKSFAEAIEESSLGDASRRVLTQLCQLYATYGIVENHGHFLQVIRDKRAVKKFATLANEALRKWHKFGA